jgi:hypothetical protein
MSEKHEKMSATQNQMVCTFNPVSVSSHLPHS